MTKKVTCNLIIIILFSCIYTFPVFAQEVNKRAIPGKISCAEKRWILFHPFIAKKSLEISKEVLLTVDSIKTINRIDNDINGGQLDAFKHAYWMALLSKHIKSRKALKLGKAHEKGNYKTYKKAKRKGIPNSYDKVSSEMDLWNNQQGIEIGKELKGNNLMIIQQAIIDSIQSGKMKTISKNASGQFLDCEGTIIPLENLMGKWENEKCLVPSNYRLVED